MPSRRATEGGRVEPLLHPAPRPAGLLRVGLVVAPVGQRRGTWPAARRPWPGRTRPWPRPGPRARGSSSSWGTTSLTRPHAHAVAASTKLPVRDICRARLTPIELGQADGHAAGRQHPDPGMGVGEGRPLRGDQEVAPEGQLQATGHRRAVDGPDDRRGGLGHQAPPDDRCPPSRPGDGGHVVVGAGQVASGRVRRRTPGRGRSARWRPPPGRRRHRPGPRPSEAIIAAVRALRASGRSRTTRATGPWRSVVITPTSLPPDGARTAGALA